jgi:hypothetical protein
MTWFLKMVISKSEKETDSIVVGPGFGSHTYTSDMRGSEPKSPHDFTVYLTESTNIIKLSLLYQRNYNIDQVLSSLLRIFYVDNIEVKKKHEVLIFSYCLYDHANVTIKARTPYIYHFLEYIC